MTFETMLANLATKLTVRVGGFYRYSAASDDESYSMKREEEHVPCCQCNILQLILLADYHTFRKYITFLFIKCMIIWSSNLDLTKNLYLIESY